MTGKTSKCTKENVFKVAAVTTVILIILQFGVSSIFYQYYHPLAVLVSSKIAPVGKQNSSGEFVDIRDFIVSGQLRHKDRLGIASPSLNANASLPRKDEACPFIPPNLRGAVSVDKSIKSYDEIKANYPDLLPGGRWKPKDCVSRHRVAIIIPYRDREAHLKVFLQHMHKFLQDQQLDYGIYVIELAMPTKFNRAMLMNIGFVEALKLYDYQCFVFHDVDLIPEDERNIYSCPEQPRHMSAAVDTMGYRLPYEAIFGGVSALTKDQMKNVNGFSNKFFGWGGEDDDMHNRIVAKGYKIIRYPIKVARYKMLSHKKDKANPERMGLLYQGRKRFASDGLNSLKYKVNKVELRPLYTWVYVEINEEEVKKS
ncbi:beta-1,4-N-acetylgalactosaminyltransferase bre-4-like isoform X2 [Liolophura sinensis]|uniref:beta-1,4-N-acetylgalactosaminyltransferase bre-4-like isoform X2 n=1 Tax=Liolophura sinensis TaxID=3198878 RepID=UPI003158DF30